jgi:TonB family protein
MPDSMRALVTAGLLCLPLALGFCQDNPPVAVHRPAQPNPASGSLVHFRLGESYLKEDNLQSAANEFREALNGDQDPKWTEVWSHIQLARIFDIAGQHDRAINEYRQAARTGDNTNGALDEANNYLQHAGQAIYLPHPSFSDQPIQKTDPEYTEEARIAELEGTVVLDGVIDEEGFARNLTVRQSLGLGLDENAIEAVKQWHFQPRVYPSQAKIASQIAVDFRLGTKRSRWHLIQVHFDTPAGVARPVFASAPYPIGAGIGPEALEEGSVLAAVGRLATAKLKFDVDEQGAPLHFQVLNSSIPVWGSEATALVSQWRFTPGKTNGIPIPGSCTVELVWGTRELTSDLERQLHDVMAFR